HPSSLRLRRPRLFISSLLSPGGQSTRRAGGEGVERRGVAKGARAGGNAPASIRARVTSAMRSKLNASSPRRPRRGGGREGVGGSRDRRRRSRRTSTPSQPPPRPRTTRTVAGEESIPLRPRQFVGVLRLGQSIRVAAIAVEPGHRFLVADQLPGLGVPVEL